MRAPAQASATGSGGWPAQAVHGIGTGTHDGVKCALQEYAPQHLMGGIVAGLARVAGSETS